MELKFRDRVSLKTKTAQVIKPNKRCRQNMNVAINHLDTMRPYLTQTNQNY